jgi:hypothetical protein
MLRTLLAASILALIVATSSMVHAQGFGGNSAFGRSSGSSFGSGMGGSGFGNSFGSGMGGMGSGMSGFGGMGGMGSGFGGMGSGMSGFGGMGSGSSPFGNSGFGGSGFGGSGGQNFVGRDLSGMESSWNQMGEAGAQFFNQMNRGMSRNNRAESKTTTATNPPQPMRVNMRVAFPAPFLSQAQVTNNVRTRVGQLLASQGVASPQITMDGNVVVLGGMAATDSQRLLLEKLVAMEPGVREVRNEMTIVPPTAPEQLPASGN